MHRRALVTGIVQLVVSAGSSRFVNSQFCGRPHESELIVSFGPASSLYVHTYEQRYFQTFWSRKRNKKSKKTSPFCSAHLYILSINRSRDYCGEYSPNPCGKINIRRIVGVTVFVHNAKLQNHPAWSNTRCKTRESLKDSIISWLSRYSYLLRRYMYNLF